MPPLENVYLQSMEAIGFVWVLPAKVKTPTDLIGMVFKAVNISVVLCLNCVCYHEFIPPMWNGIVYP